MSTAELPAIVAVQDGTEFLDAAADAPRARKFLRRVVAKGTAFGLGGEAWRADVKAGERVRFWRDVPAADAGDPETRVTVYVEPNGATRADGDVREAFFGDARAVAWCLLHGARFVISAASGSTNMYEAGITRRTIRAEFEENRLSLELDSTIYHRGRSVVSSPFPWDSSDADARKFCGVEVAR